MVRKNHSRHEEGENKWGEGLKEVVVKFKCLGAICVDRRIEEEVTHMSHEGREIWRMLRELRNENTKSMKIKRQLYEKVVISTVVYGSDT